MSWFRSNGRRHWTWKQQMAGEVPDWILFTCDSMVAWTWEWSQIPDWTNVWPGDPRVNSHFFFILLKNNHRAGEAWVLWYPLLYTYGLRRASDCPSEECSGEITSCGYELWWCNVVGWSRSPTWFWTLCLGVHHTELQYPLPCWSYITSLRIFHVINLFHNSTDY